MLTDLSPPSVEPISRDEAKLFLRIDHDDENDLIDMLIQSARERLEAYLNVAIISRPMRYEAQGGEIKIPRWPVVSIDHVAVNGQAVTAYQTELRCRPAVLKNVASAPVTIDFTAGYGPTADSAPSPLRQALLLLISQGYEARGETIEAIPLMVDALTLPYKVVGL